MKSRDFGCRKVIVTSGRVAQDEVVVAEVVDVSVGGASRELFGYALDKVPASDRAAARPAIVPAAAVG